MGKEVAKAPCEEDRKLFAQAIQEAFDSKYDRELAVACFEKLNDEQLYTVAHAFNRHKLAVLEKALSAYKGETAEEIVVVLQAKAYVNAARKWWDDILA